MQGNLPQSHNLLIKAVPQFTHKSILGASHLAATYFDIVDILKLCLKGGKDNTIFVQFMDAYVFHRKIQLLVKY